MKPTFYSLYKRGTYRRIPGGHESESDIKKREQKERYAMAAIGFVLHYDPDFYNYFLSCICEVTTPAPRLVDIIVEDKLWGDMVIETGDSIYVIEAKIHAPLKDHQNPQINEFWEGNGYAEQIKRHFTNGKMVHYIILGWEHDIKPQTRGLHCMQKFWCHLEKDYPDLKGLAEDLADCLGQLGISEFDLRKTKKMKINQSLQQAAQAHKIFDDVIQEMDRKKWELDHHTDEGGWFMGMVLKNSSHNLKDIVQAKDNKVCWFGYSGTNEKEWSRSIWLYCGSATHMSALQKRLDTGEAYQVTPRIEDGETYLEITSKQPGAQNDFEWFKDAFKHILLEGDQSKPKPKNGHQKGRRPQK